MIVVLPQAGMMGTAGVPPQKTMTRISLMDSVQRHVSVQCHFFHLRILTRSVS